jgi:ABC-type lipoprotein release transport system permease subunit
MAAGRLLAAGLYEIGPLDPVVFASVTALVALTAVSASAVPAWRAVTIEPVIALRQE